MTFELSGRAITTIAGYAAVISGFILAVALLYFHPDPAQVTARPLRIAAALLIIFPFAIAVATILIDLTQSDHRTAFHFRTAEKPISLQWRLARNLVLITYPQLLILGYATFDLIGKGALAGTNLGPIFILISAIMATIGWLYTNYVSSLKTRHTATIDHLNRLVSNQRHRNYASALKAFIAQHHREGVDGIGDLTFPLKDVERLWTAPETVNVDGKEYTFREVCRYFLGYLEHVAISIRVGIYDFDIMQRQRRRRLMLYFNTLFYVIVFQSEATSNKPHRRKKYDYRRGNDIWENFIWLTMKMDDNSRINSDIRPCKRIDPRRHRDPRTPSPKRDLDLSHARFYEIDDA